MRIFPGRPARGRALGDNTHLEALLLGAPHPEYQQLGGPETLTKIGGGVFPDTHSQNWIDGAVNVQALFTFIGELLDYYYADTTTTPTEVLRGFDVATVRLIPRQYGNVTSFRRPGAE